MAQYGLSEDDPLAPERQFPHAEPCQHPNHKVQGPTFSSCESQEHSGYPQGPRFERDDEKQRGQDDEIFSRKSAIQVNAAEQDIPRFEVVRSKQLLSLLATGFYHFCITFSLCAGLFAALWSYSSDDSVTKEEKKIFNFLVTGFSMLLALNLTTSLRHIALNARWMILSRRRRPLKDVDAILSCYSLVRLTHLTHRSIRRGQWRTVFICVLWILLNILAQLGVAVIGLNYSIDPTMDSDNPVPGKIIFTNVSLSLSGYDTGSMAADELSAHMYGAMSLFLYSEQVNSTDPIVSPVKAVTPYSRNFTDFWITPDYVQYVFLDTPADSASLGGQFYSNRSIYAKSVCDVLPVIDGGPPSSDNTLTILSNGTVQVANFTNVGPESTTYYVGTNLTCGQRCAALAVFENNGTAGYYYQCSITLGNITNTTLPSQQISDKTAKVAAGAIALVGYHQKNQTEQDQRYPQDSYYGKWLNGNATVMAERLREYAIGVIAGLDKVNPYIASPVLGLVPNATEQLKLNRPDYIIGILSGILGGQLLLFVAGALYSNRVVVIKDSYLVISKLFSPVVEKIGERGSVHDVERCYKIYGDRGVLYGDRMEETGRGRLRKLEISGEARPGKHAKDWEGYYD